MNLQKRNRFVPVFESLEAREVPAKFTFDGVNLWIKGGSGSDHIRIVDDGRERLHVYTDDNRLPRVFHDVQTITIETGGGNDRVSYNLAGDLLTRYSFRRRDITVDLGSGNDNFLGNIGGDIHRNLLIDVRGSYGDDILRMRATNAPGGPTSGVDVARNKIFRVHLHGGYGDDWLSSQYTGELDGTLDLHAAGGYDPYWLFRPITPSDRDYVDVQVNALYGSTGQVGTDENPATVEGGKDNDTLIFRVNVPWPVSSNAIVDGGSGQDWMLSTSSTVSRQG